MLLQSSLKDLFALQSKKWKEKNIVKANRKMERKRKREEEFCYSFVLLPKVLLPILGKMKLFHALVTTPKVPP